jgi:hypothetical protein
VPQLTNGSTYCFAMSAVTGANESAATAVHGPVTVAAATTGHTLSGTATFPTVSGAGALSVIVYDQSSGAVRYQRIASPTSPQAFSITGVPNGTYIFGAFLDANGNGEFDPTDPNNLSGSGNQQAHVTVSADMSNLTTTLPGVNSTASVLTQYADFGSGPQYTLQFEVDANLKLPVTATLVLGPNLATAIDLGTGQNQGGQLRTNVNLPSATPAVNQAYTLQVTYSDGSSDMVNASVTGIVTSLPTALAPNGITASSDSPTFSWTAPATPPSSYTYTIQVTPHNSGQELWRLESMSSSTTSIGYDSDLSASLNPLTTTVQYDWRLAVFDAFGNTSQAQATFTAP